MKKFTIGMIALFFMLGMLRETIAQFATGDVMVAVANGSTQWRKPNGTLMLTMVDGTGGFTTGMAFDTAGNLYVTNFSNSAVHVFNTFGTHMGTFGSGYSTPESIVFDGAANAYVGNLGNGIRKYDATGTFLSTSYGGRVDFMDLQADQCTMLRDFEGSTIETHDVCTNTPGATFASGLTQAFALRIIPTGPFAGHVLVADLNHIKRFDAAGVLQTTYDATGENAWFALNLDPDGVTFWSADFGTSNVYRFNISTGAVVTSWNTGTGSNTVFGLAVRGEITAATILYIHTLPRFAINPINTQHCVTSTVTDQNNNPISGEVVDFTVSGCNATSGSGSTNAAGEVQFCYVGTQACCDTIYATIRSTGRQDTVIKCWDNAGPVEMQSLTSTVNERDVTLNWSTSAEINNSGFDIERSSGNNDWSRVGFVQGNGTTSEPNQYAFTDRNVASGKYNYRLKQIDFNGNFEYYYLSNEVIVGIPSQFNLAQNYPNPFNPTTKIDFELPKEGNVKLYVYDNSGKEVAMIANGFRAAGYYTVEFNASNLASGIYFYKLEYTNGTQNMSKVLKMTVLK